jgi:hypothetical protein
LIRFCYQNQTDFIELSDGQFVLFVWSLSGPASSLLRHSVAQRAALEDDEVVGDPFDFFHVAQ